MSEPLNPILYERLRRRFRHVKIAAEGQAMVSTYKTMPSGFRVLDPSNLGEYYQVCCPRCNDTRFRLWINHRWGRRDAKTGSQNLWLAICYNENCYASEEARLDLYEQVAGIDQVLLSNASVRRGEVVTVAKEVTLPGPHYRLDNLPDDHPANAYLAGRFYDTKRLGKFYHVGYCPDSHYYLARNRIVAPLYFEGKLRGWQARYIGDIDWKAEGAPPKWWSCPGMDRSKVLYNFDVARQYRTGVAMEGFGDVWAFGPMGIACLGSTITNAQQKLFAAAFARGSAVILMDPDVREENGTKFRKLEELTHEWRLHKVYRHGVALVWLPDGTDPGKLDRKFLRDYVADHAGQQGVKVDWRKW